jgi:hypothetical protein
MAITVAQNAFNHNGLNQTFNVTFAGTPTEGNLLVACYGGQETVADGAALTSNGWVRQATLLGAAQAPDVRINVYAKWAGASEATVVAFDVGEASKRCHGLVFEASGVAFSNLHSANEAPIVSFDNAAAAFSGTVSEAITIGDEQLGICLMHGTGNSGAGAWDSGATEIDEQANVNFASSILAYIEGGGSVTPKCTWAGFFTQAGVVVVLGAAAAGGTPSGVYAAPVTTSDIVAAAVTTSNPLS